MDWRKPLRLLTLSLMTTALRAEAPRSVVLLASTIGPVDSGIVTFLEDRFEAETGIRVRHVGAGTGAALELARQGSVDLVLVHAKSLEEAFVAEGHGTQRLPLMYNDFVIVGPEADPAGLRGTKTAAEALRKIVEKGSPFVSRGDRSGTHMAELELWTRAGLKPSGAWYQIFARGAEGNQATLLHTDAQAAYTVIDRASYLGTRDRVRLTILVEGDEALLNHISLIPVNPLKHPRVHAAEALAFATWLRDPAKGQALIAAFGREKFGAPLFVPEGQASKLVSP